MICSAAQLQPSVRQERHNIPLPEERGVLLEAEGMLHCGKCESVPLFLTLLIFFLKWHIFSAHVLRHVFCVIMRIKNVYHICKSLYCIYLHFTQESNFWVFAGLN